MIRDEDLDQNDERETDPADDEAVGSVGHGPLGFLGGVVIGALVGAGVALLLAPARGDVVRRRLRRRLRTARRRARHQLDHLRSDVRRELRRRQLS